MTSVIYYSLLAVVLIAPLPFGSDRPWSESTLSLCVGLLLLAWVATTAFKRVPVRIKPVMWLPIGMFLAVVAWGFLQSVKGVSWAWQHPLWHELPAILGHSVAGTISLNPFASANSVMKLMAYGGIFWLAMMLCRSGTRSLRGIQLVAGAGFVYAIYGIVVFVFGFETVIFTEKKYYIGDLTSTFINRNNYATYAGLGLVCAFSMIVKAVGELQMAHGGRSVLRKTIEDLLRNQLPYVVMVLVLLMALLQTHSRMGLLSTAVGLVAILGCGWASGLLPRKSLLILLAAFLAMGGVAFLVSGDVTLGRILDTLNFDRIPIFRLAIVAIADAPWLGTGYGTFGEVFRIYRDTTLTQPVDYDLAHNTYLELVLELGLPAAALLICSILSIVLICIAGVRTRRRNVIFPCIAVASSVLVGVHSLTDFSGQIPAVAATFSFLLGVGCGQSWRSTGRSHAASNDVPSENHED